MKKIIIPIILLFFASNLMTVNAQTGRHPISFYAPLNEADVQTLINRQEGFEIQKIVDSVLSNYRLVVLIRENKAVLIFGQGKKWFIVEKHRIPANCITNFEITEYYRTILGHEISEVNYGRLKEILAANVRFLDLWSFEMAMEKL